MIAPRLFIALATALAMGYSARAGDFRGASCPWTTYEAEQSQTNGRIEGPDYTGHTAAREASGRRCVRLSSTGDYMQFKADSDAQGIVVRYSIPDSPDGRGLDATLSLFIGGKLRGKLPMTSRLSYVYGDYPFSNDPAAWPPRHFWDELRIMPGAIHRGETIRLQKDADDSAAWYLIDFVDLEKVPPPLQQPGNSISITSFGAAEGGKIDARPAFISAIAAARTQHKSVWIPAGRFLVKGAIDVQDVTIRGAGMWYSTLVGTRDYTPDNRVAIRGAGSNVTLSDFAIAGNLNYRNDREANDGIVGSFGTGSVIRDIWVEHTKTGAWLTNSDGLIVENCRFRGTMADGINLCVGMRNTIVRNCTARGTGDDCFAIWPANYTEAKYVPGLNRIVRCTAELPYLAQGFAVYGGDANSIENCKAVDICYGAGLFASTTFRTEFGFRGITRFENIDLTRSGNSNGSIGIVTDLIDLSGLRFQDIDVVDSPTDGIKFISLKGRVLSDASFDRIRIVDPGMSGAGSGVVASGNAVGSARIENVTVLHPKDSGVRDEAAGFKLIRGPGNVVDRGEKIGADAPMAASLLTASSVGH